MMKLEGVEVVIKNLEYVLLGIPPDEQRKAGAKALQPIIDIAKQKAPVSKRAHYFYNSKDEKVKVTPGNLKRSIKVLRKWRGDPAAAYAGPEVVRRNASGVYDGERVNAYYAHFVEYGTASHKVGYGGDKGPTVRGIAARPYMRPAYDMGKQAAMEMYMKLLEELVMKRAGHVPGA